MTLHPDWPEFDPTSSDLPPPVDDLDYALAALTIAWSTAEPLPRPVPAVQPFTLAEIAKIDRYDIDYNNRSWTPGDAGGTELDMAVLLQLHDGRWATVVVWNDFTGWDCQDGGTIHVGPTREAVIRYGLSDEDRRRLGVSLDPA